MVNYNHLPKHSPYFQGALYQRMNEDLQLAGMSQRTVHGYLRAVRQLADWAETEPNQLTKSQLRRYFLYLKNEKQFAYRCLFDASSQTIRDVGAATRSLRNCRLGFFGVLHTWGRDLRTYHPHIHYVIPGGGVTVDEHGRAVGWQSTPTNFLFHHGTLLRVYQAKLADSLRAAGLYDRVPSEVWQLKFVVDIQSVGHAEPTLKYLAPYVYRVAISDKRIESVDESSVTYRVRPSKSHRTTSRTVDGSTFVRSFAQHVLPSGFQKIRHYGWMSANSRIKLDEVAWLVWLYLGWTWWLGSGHAPQPKSLTQPLLCAECGEVMRVVGVSHHPTYIPASFRALAYFDSG